jgi:hypothetical protein
MSSYSSSTYQASCGDHTLQRRQAVCVHSREQAGHTPCVSNVFQTWPHPSGLQLHVSCAEGCHWQAGQRMCRRRARPSRSLIRTFGALNAKRVISSRMYVTCRPMETGFRAVWMLRRRVPARHVFFPGAPTWRIRKAGAAANRDWQDAEDRPAFFVGLPVLVRDGLYPGTPTARTGEPPPPAVRMQRAGGGGAVRDHRHKMRADPVVERHPGPAFRALYDPVLFQRRASQMS